MNLPGSATGRGPYGTDSSSDKARNALVESRDHVFRTLQRDEMADAVIGSYFDDNSRGPNLINMVPEEFEYLVARNGDEEGFFLVWNGSSTPPVFDEDVYECIVKESLAASLKPIYHVYARYNLYQSDDVKFYQIPNRILMDFGVTTANDAFHNEDEIEAVELD